MNQQQSELHLIKVILLLKRVNISVRFPCSISFALKNDNSIVEHKSIYDLRKGECLINQSIETQMQVWCRRGIYDEKKISLLIYMISVNGKIPAGSVTINPTEKIIADKHAPLEKCPDKNAEAIYMQNVQFIQLISRTVTHSKLEMGMLSSPGDNFLNRSKMKYSASTKNICKSEDCDLVQDSVKIQFRPEGQKLYSSKHQQSSKDLRLSEVAISDYDRRGSRVRLSRFEELSKKSVSGTIEKESTEMKGSRFSSQLIDESQEDIKQRSSRIIKLQQDKANYIKKLARIRDSLVRIDSEQRLLLEDEIQKVKFDKDILHDEVENLKERSRVLQKKQRESGSLMKQLREELDKRKSRIMQLDSSRMKIQSQISQKDKQIYQLTNQNKKLQSLIEEEKSVSSSSLKRLELKQNSYKDQLKKLNEKYALSQSQRQKILVDYSNLLANIQNSQKKNQVFLRQKQKSLIQQKSRLNKKIEQLLIQANLSSEKNLELNEKLIEFQSSRNKALKQNEEKQSKILHLSQENQVLLGEIRSSQQSFIKVLQEKEKIEKMFQQDKVSYKRKFHDAMNELNILKDRLEKTSQANISIQSRVADLQNHLQRQIRQKTGLCNKIQEYRRQLQKNALQQENRERMAQSLSTQNMNLSSKVNQFKIKFQNQRKKFDLMQTKYQEQVQYLINSKEMLQNEVEELKWTTQKQNEKFETVCKRTSELNEQVMELNHKIMQLQEKQAYYINEIDSKEQAFKVMETEIIHLDQKVKFHSDRFKQKEDQCYNLQKNLSLSMEQIKALNQQIAKNNDQLKQKNQELRNIQEQAKNKLQGKEEYNILLDEQLRDCKKLINELKQEVKLKNNQLLSLKQNYKALNQDYSVLTSKSQIIKEQERIKDNQIEQLQSIINEQKQKGSSTQKELERKILQFEQYKQNTFKALFQLFQLLNQDQYSIRTQTSMILMIPDERLAPLQIQTINKRNNFYVKSKQTVFSLTSIIQNLQNQIKSKQAILDQQEQSHFKILKQQHDRNQALSQYIQRQIHEFQEKMQVMSHTQDSHANEIQCLNDQIKRYESIVQNANEQIEQLKKDNSDLKGSLIKRQNQLFDWKQKQIKSKMLVSGDEEDVKQMLKLQRQHSKQMMQIHKQEIKHKERLINDKNEQSKKIKIRQQQLKIQLTQLNQRIAQLNAKFQAESIIKNHLQRQLKDKQIKEKTNEENNAQLKSNISELKISQRNLIQQNNKQRDLITHQEQKIQEQILFKNKELEEMKELQRKQREKRQKLEGLRLRLQQQNSLLKKRNQQIQSKIQVKQFQRLQRQKKIDQLQKYLTQMNAEIRRNRQLTARNQDEKGINQSKYYKLQVEKEGILKQKIDLLNENEILKQKIDEFQQKAINHHQFQSLLEEKNKQIDKLLSIIKLKDQQIEKTNAEMKLSLAKSKQSLVQRQNKVKQMQRFLQDRYDDISSERMKWQKQSEVEKNELKAKIMDLQDKYQMIQEEYQFQKMQAVRQIQSTNGIIHELNEIIRDKEQILQQKEEIINEQIVRLQELNIQLNQCVNKWEAEKQSYLPTQTKMAQINDEMTRMNAFIGQLDGRNKQLLQINKRKMQQNIVSRPSITEQLKEIYVLLQKNKNKILNRCMSDKEKEMVINQFKLVQEKLDLTLKSSNLVNVKQ